ncbi:MAG: hypothetical protein ACOC5R_00775 [Elusimicrobiota bacterium]
MDKNLILGIDEAGMGPVFGPMVVSGVVIDIRNKNDLKNIGVKESKSIGSGPAAHKKRKEILEKASFFVKKVKKVVIDAETIDGSNMYDLHAEAVRSILEELEWDKIGQVYIEQVGNLKKEKYFSRIGFWHSGFTYQPKADLKFISVSLASVYAKVARDNSVEKLCSDIDFEYVSGYANRKTEEFFKKYYSLYGCLPQGTRRSRRWAPLQEILQKCN